MVLPTILKQDSVNMQIPKVAAKLLQADTTVITWFFMKLCFGYWCFQAGEGGKKVEQAEKRTTYQFFESRVEILNDTETLDYGGKSDLQC